MKKSIKTQKIITGITSASLIISPSCSSLDSIDGDDIYQKETINDESALGDSIIPMSFKLKPEDVAYMSALQRLSNDIIENKDIAKNYINNPIDALKAYGYTGQVKKDDYLLKLVLAFGDDDIHEAIKNSDIEKYLTLCKEKGIWEEGNQGIFGDEFYQPQKDSLEKAINRATLRTMLDGDHNNNRINNDSGFGGYYEVVAIAGVAVLVIAGVGVAATVGLVFTTYAVAGHTVLVYSDRAAPQNDVLGTIYMLKSDDKNYYSLMDDQKNKIIDQTIDYIKQTTPKYFETNSEEALRNILRYNLKDQSTK